MAHVRVAGDIDRHGAARHKESFIVDGHHGVGRLRVGKRWRIRNNNRPEGVATAATNQIKAQHEPQPEKPLHSNSVEKVSVARKPILYREPGREGKSGGAWPAALVRSAKSRVWLPQVAIFGNVTVETR